MAVKIRLQRKGRRKNPFYHIVIADARAPRDGRFIEKLGVYNPMTKPATIDIDRDKAYDWLLKGAQPTDTVRAILRFKGILYRKHLMRGVNKGAVTQEDADRMYQEWIDSKESKIASRVEETKKEIKQRHENIFGVPVAKKAPEPEPAPEVEEPVAEAVEEAAEEVAVEAVEEVAEVVEAEAPAVEAAAEEPAAEEAPAAEEEEKAE